MATVTVDVVQMHLNAMDSAMSDLRHALSNVESALRDYQRYRDKADTALQTLAEDIKTPTD